MNAMVRGTGIPITSRMLTGNWKYMRMKKVSKVFKKTSKGTTTAQKRPEVPIAMGAFGIFKISL
jgi:hypothetical protein